MPFAGGCWRHHSTHNAHSWPESEVGQIRLRCNWNHFHIFFPTYRVQSHKAIIIYRKRKSNVRKLTILGPPGRLIYRNCENQWIWGLAWPETNFARLGEPFAHVYCCPWFRRHSLDTLKELSYMQRSSNGRGKHVFSKGTSEVRLSYLCNTKIYGHPNIHQSIPFRSLAKCNQHPPSIHQLTENLFFLGTSYHTTPHHNSKGFDKSRYRSCNQSFI